MTRKNTCYCGGRFNYKINKFRTQVQLYKLPVSKKEIQFLKKTNSFFWDLQEAKFTRFFTLSKWHQKCQFENVSIQNYDSKFENEIDSKL